MLKLISKWLSKLFYPFISIAWFYVYGTFINGAISKLECLGFALMVGFPAIIWLIWNVKRGYYQDADVSDKRKRQSLYYFLIGIFMVYNIGFYYQFGRVDVKILYLLGLTIVLFLSNYFIKTSMHTAYNVFVATLFYSLGALEWCIVWILVTMIVGWSRLVLKRHSKNEVVLGGVIGIVVSICYICTLRI
ncbi:hypothetical protein [Riemerella columbina]|uniref:hypothetical protein n=1 Tax=Riemerella columbina TaxID=103810 RepID=UPI000362905D|nr:hypothetical protein [Riemerella columbina]